MIDEQDRQRAEKNGVPTSGETSQRAPGAGEPKVHRDRNPQTRFNKDAMNGQTTVTLPTRQHHQQGGRRR